MTIFPNDRIEAAAIKTPRFHDWLKIVSLFELGWNTCSDGHMMLSFILKLELKLETVLREYNPKIHEIALRAGRRCLSLYGKPEPTLEAAIRAKERWIRMEIDSDELTTYTVDAFTVASEWKDKEDLLPPFTQGVLVDIAKTVAWASSKNVNVVVRALQSAADVDWSIKLDRAKTTWEFHCERLKQSQDVKELFPYSTLIADTEVKTRFKREFVI